jgi:hypothetical protein
MKPEDRLKGSQEEGRSCAADGRWALKLMSATQFLIYLSDPADPDHGILRSRCTCCTGISRPWTPRAPRSTSPIFSR